MARIRQINPLYVTVLVLLLVLLPVGILILSDALGTSLNPWSAEYKAAQSAKLQAQQRLFDATRNLNEPDAHTIFDEYLLRAHYVPLTERPDDGPVFLPIIAR
jgi:hypothetical protein